MTNKKVLFIAPRFHTNQFFLTKNLISLGIEVNFLAVYIGGSENHKYLTPILSKPSRIVKWYLKKYTAISAEGRKVLRYYNITSLSQCFKLYRQLKPDIVIVRNLSFFTSMQHLIIGKLTGRKVYLYTLYGLRQNLSSSKKMAYKFLGMIGIKHYTSVIGDLAAPIVPNTLYIPMIFEPLISEKEIAHFRKHNGIKIITVGKMQQRKNLKELIQSLYRINFFENTANKLIMISECISKENRSILKDVEEVIGQGKFQSQIDLKLNAAHDEVFKLLKSSDLFVMPSHNEPAGTSMVEAMACGLPVICSSSNGAKCYINSGKNGYVFKYTEDFHDLDEKLKMVLQKDKLHAFALESLKIIEQSHNIRNFYDKIIT